MATLRIENGPQKGTKISLPGSGNFVIGSEPKKAQLVLVDSSVGKLHCALALGAEGAIMLKDLGTPTGTLVNGKKTATAKLLPGDRIQLGDTTLVLENGAPVSASAGSSPGLAGQTVGGYRIEKLVGKGGMGTVYRAVQISLDRVVALKVLSSQLIADRSFVDQFFREARAAGKLNHPNVVQVYDVGEANGIYFYSMEFMEGGTIEGRIQREGKLSLEESCVIVRDAARGLQYAEAQRIVHRDIKPDNLMLSPSGHAKIADLGLATPHETGEAGKGKILGTPHFISPEQAKGQPVDSRSDLYSLGATFFRMLTGKTPFSGKDVREILQKQMQQEAPGVRTLDPEIPEEIDLLIAKLLEKDPAQRFQSAKELAEALDAYLNRRAHAGPKLWLLAGVPAVLLVGALIVWKPWEKKDPVIVEKVIEKPDDPSKAAEAERMRQELVEKDARIALQAIASGLGSAERLASLEKVAAQFPATTAGKNAKKEADTLRAQIEEQRQAEQVRATRLAEFETRLRTLVAPLWETNRFRDAAIAIAAAPEFSAPQPDLLEKALLESLLQETTIAAQKAIGAWLVQAEAAIDEGQFANAASSLDRIPQAVAPLDGVPESIRASFESHLNFESKLREKLQTSKMAKELAIVSADAAASFEALFAGDILLRSLGELRFPEALKAIDGARSKMTTAGYTAVLDGWKSQTESCERAMAAFISHLQSQTLSEKSIKNPLNGRTQPLVGGSRAEGAAVPDPAKRDSKIWIPWGKFDTPERLAELFRNRWAMKAEESLDVAQLLLLAGLAQEAREFRNAWNAALETRAWESSAGNGKNPPPHFDLKIFSYAKELAEKAQAAGAAKPQVGTVLERIRAEEEAATRLSRAFALLFEKQFDAALREMESLRQECSSTFLFGFFSDGTTPLLAR